jgi:hypothetical protein
MERANLRRLPDDWTADEEAIVPTIVGIELTPNIPPEDVASWTLTHSHVAAA